MTWPNFLRGRCGGGNCWRPRMKLTDARAPTRFAPTRHDSCVRPVSSLPCGPLRTLESRNSCVLTAAWRRRVRAGFSASLWRSAFRSDCPVTLGLLARRNLLGAEREANAASFAARPRGELRSEVGAKRQPPQPQPQPVSPPPDTACRGARNIAKSGNSQTSAPGRHQPSSRPRGAMCRGSRTTRCRH